MPSNKADIKVTYASLDKYNELQAKDDNTIYFVVDETEETSIGHKGNFISVGNSTISKEKLDKDSIDSIKGTMSYSYSESNSGSESKDFYHYFGTIINSDNTSSVNTYIGINSPSWKIPNNYIINNVSISLSLSNNKGTTATANIQNANSSPTAEYTGGLQSENINLLDDSIEITLPDGFIDNEVYKINYEFTIDYGNKITSKLEDTATTVLNPYVLISTSQLSNDANSATALDLMDSKGITIDNSSGYIYIYVPSRLSNVITYTINGISGGLTNYTDAVSLTKDTLKDSFVGYKTDYDALGKIKINFECNF